MKEAELHNEFGGAYGAIGLMVFSHSVLYYFWISQRYYQGGLVLPYSMEDIPHFPMRMIEHIKDGAMPNASTASVYIGFILLQAFLGLIMPGVTVKGLKIPEEKDKQLDYLCNGFAGWWATLIIVFVLHYTDTFRITYLVDNFGPLMSCAILVADSFAVFLYLYGIVSKRAIRMSGNVVYDFFMGSVLNPRFFYLDIKLWAEIRVSWILLFLLTCSAAVKQYEETGNLTPSMMYMVLAHFLYTNACQKGEECIPYTWDISYEKFGWMLIFWNFAGVPFLYCFQSYYILKNQVDFHNPILYGLLFSSLVTAYVVWDTAQSQKARFKMKQIKGGHAKRWTFPQLPWGTIENPEFIKAKNGGTLLVSGWFAYARKIYYFADFVMAMGWGLSCGVGGAMPFFYPLFFGTMLLHRYTRDIERCRQKYGEAWEEYCRKVPYAFVPGLF